MDKQRDFEKGWEEYKAKRKQEIEEMAKVLCINDNFVCETCPSENECFNYKHAKQLYDAGYSKIPENAVVLTREDREEFNELYRSALQRAEKWEKLCGIKIKETRKETVEKFAERLKARFHKSREYYEVDTGTAWSDGCIGGLINDTIDEIAKEIMEGE